MNYITCIIMRVAERIRQQQSCSTLALEHLNHEFPLWDHQEALGSIHNLGGCLREEIYRSNQNDTQCNGLVSFETIGEVR